MDVLAVNCAFLQTPIEGVHVSHYSASSSGMSDSTAIKGQLKDKTVIVIAADITSKNNENMIFPGLELSLWLRLINLELPVFLVGWLSLDKLLKYDKYAIILSTARVHYLQLPCQLNNQTITYHLKSNTNQTLHHILPLLFDKIKFRHSEANWWSVKLLYDVYNGLAGSQIDYPSAIKDRLNDINNFIAQSLYHFDETEFKTCTREYLLKKTTQEELEHINKLKETEILIKKNEIIYSLYTKKSDADSELIERMQLEIQQLKADSALFQLQIESIKASANNGVKLSYKSDINKNLLIIDDKIHSGWRDAYHLLFPNACITTLEPDIKYKNDLTAFFESEVKKLLQGKDLLILDLRLFDEKSAYISPEELSGVQLLKTIRQYHLDIPILITSASNKSAVFKTVMQCGADAYWLKQGIDEEKSVADSIQNYFNLIEYVDKLTSNVEYTLLKQLFEIYKNCSVSPVPWWTNMTWINDTKTFVNKNILLEYLLQIINLYRFYLQNKIQADLPYNFDSKHFLASIINKIGGIVELIHGYHLSDEYAKINREVKSERGDSLGVEILDLRNKASHYNTLHIDIRNLKEIVDLIEQYLTTEQCFQDIVLSDYSVQCGENKLILKDNITQNKYSCSVRKNGTRYFDEVIKTYRDVKSNRPIKIKVNNKEEGLIIIDESTLPVAILNAVPDKTRKELNLATSEFYSYRVIAIKGKVYKLSDKASDCLFKNNQIELVFDAKNCQWQIPIR